MDRGRDHYKIINLMSIYSLITCAQTSSAGTAAAGIRSVAAVAAAGTSRSGNIISSWLRRGSRLGGTHGQHRPLLLLPVLHHETQALIDFMVQGYRVQQPVVVVLIHAAAYAEDLDEDKKEAACQQGEAAQQDVQRHGNGAHGKAVTRCGCCRNAAL